MTVEIFLSDFQSTVNDVPRIFVFQRLTSSFLRNCFFGCPTDDCLHSHFILFLCVFGNWMGMGIIQWESHGNGNKWELTAWKWKGMECEHTFTVTSTCNSGGVLSVRGGGSTGHRMPGSPALVVDRTVALSINSHRSTPI